MSEPNAFDQELPPLPWTKQQDVVYEALVRSGVVGLPTQKVGVTEPLWAHPVLWFCIALPIILATLFLMPNDSPTARRPDELLVLPPTFGDLLWLLPLLLLPVALPALLRVLASRKNELLELQTMADVHFYLPGVFAGIVRRSLAGGPEWHRLRARFSRTMLVASLLPLALAGLGLYVVHGNYRAVHRDGIREVTLAGVREYDWSDVIRINAKCGLNDGWYWAYEVRFRSGDEYNLIRRDRRGLDLVSRIDQMLAEMGIPKRGEPPDLVEACTSGRLKEEERAALRGILSRR